MFSVCKIRINLYHITEKNDPCNNLKPTRQLKMLIPGSLINLISLPLELYTLYDEPDTVKVVEIGRLRWLRHVFRML